MSETSYSFLPDIASRALGGSVVWANDELFAERENLINATPPTFAAHTFGHKGQVMDGWETRRRRGPGQDSAIIRLGAGGILRSVIVDTAFFTGNFPPEISIDACGVDGYLDPEALQHVSWVPLVPRSKVNGNALNDFEVIDDHRYTHVRLTMYPDGGIARLRVRGEIVPDPRVLPGVFDLAALDNGGAVTGASNVFYASPGNLIMPGTARVMGEGWETARRRDDGNDWVDVELAAAATIDICELDTSHFVGNSPGWASVTAPDGVELLSKRALQPDCRHRFVVATDEPVSRVRLDIFPDGGMARMRLLGSPTAAGRAALALRFVNTIPDGQLRVVLARLGFDGPTSESLLAARPFADVTDCPIGLQQALRVPATA